MDVASLDGRSLQHPGRGSASKRPIAHLRGNISRVIESDVRDFSRSPHSVYQGPRPLRAEGRSRLAQALMVRDRSEPGNSCQKANLVRRFTRHCINSAFFGISMFAPEPLVSAPELTSVAGLDRVALYRAAGPGSGHGFPVGAPSGSDDRSSCPRPPGAAAEAFSRRYRSSPDPTSAGKCRSRSSAASMRCCR
jgi:hypothetical protein